MASIKKRGDKWRVQIRKQGTPSISKTFIRRTDAENWATKMEIAMDNGEYGIVGMSKNRTVEEAIGQYIADKGLDRSTDATTKQQVKKLGIWKKLLGSYYLSRLTPELIKNARNTIAKIPTPKGTEKTNSTINRYHAALSVVLSYAKKELSWIKYNPIEDIAKPPESKGIVRYLSDAERERLFQFLDDRNDIVLKALVVSALVSGARACELTNLKWDKVDLDAGTALLTTSKNKEPRTLVLAEPALGLIKQLYATRKNDGYVFTKNGISPINGSSTWNQIKPKLGFGENFRFHDLRHTCASDLAMHGATLLEIADVLGHKSLEMTKRYAHLSSKHKCSVVEKVCKKIYGTPAENENHC